MRVGGRMTADRKKYCCREGRSEKERDFKTEKVGFLDTLYQFQHHGFENPYNKELEDCNVTLPFNLSSFGARKDRGGMRE